DLPTSLAVISERTSDAMYGRAITITQIFWTVGILLSQFLGFLTSAMTVGSVRVIFSVIALVALVNLSVWVFSPKFKRVEDSLVDDQKATFNSQNGQPRVKLGEILKNPAYLKILVALTMFYLFWNLPANTWGSFVNYFLVTVSH
ncbi:MFS transporter, partial [Clostridioides difficile]|uniref:MFS transporter n=1 Tax=Clostridioides difficile TaxID=1496 RepID=UPI0023587E97